MRYHRMCVAALVAAVFAGPQAMAEGFDRGAALYEHHCMECHESWAHERRTRKVANLDELRHRVTSWSLHSSLGWGADEIDDVSDYLNRKFYQFGSEQ